MYDALASAGTDRFSGDSLSSFLTSKIPLPIRMARGHADALRAGDSAKSGPMASRLEVSRSYMVQLTSTKMGGGDGFCEKTI